MSTRRIGRGVLAAALISLSGPVASAQADAAQSRAMAARPIPARTATAHKPARAVVIPQWAVDLARKHTQRAGRPARPGVGRGGTYTMPRRDVRVLLRVSWQAFGYQGAALRYRVRMNLRQVNGESGRRPAVLQGFIGDVNDYNPAGGLVQFIKPTMNHWQVAGRGNRFNPLDNLLAAVNAQVHGPYRILDGSSGWSPPSTRNPLRGRNGLRVAKPSAWKASATSTGGAKAM